MILIKNLNLFLCCLLLNKVTELYYNKKNARNMVSFIHASSVVFLIFLYILTNYNLFLNFALNFSIGYFLFDIYYIIMYDKLNFLRYCYIYHHLGSMYIINNNNFFGNAHLFLLVGELSNIPSYFIYHYLHLDYKTEETEKKVIFYKKIQKYIYAIIRIPIISYITYNTLIQLDPNSYIYYGIILSGVPIYLMGLIWSYKLFLY